MINAYDFDGTIYNGDSTIDFYIYCLKRKKSIIFLLPVQFYGFILYKLKIKKKEYFKEKFFIFLNKIDNIDDYIDDFCSKNVDKIKGWYLKQKNNQDLIISASPEFIILEFCKRLGVKNLIATKVDKRTGKFLSDNCYGGEKVKRFKKEMPNIIIEKFYSDSMSDKPMMDISKEAYIVCKDNLRLLK